MPHQASRRRFVKTLTGAAGAATAGRASAQPAGRVRGFDHVAVPMQNTEKMIAFYRAVGLRLNETPSAVSAYVGDQMINFHRPSRWQDPADTLRAPGGGRASAITFEILTAISSSS